MFGLASPARLLKRGHVRPRHVARRGPAIEILVRLEIGAWQVLQRIVFFWKKTGCSKHDDVEPTLQMMLSAKRK